MRRLVIILGSLAVVLLTAIGLLPWWLGAALSSCGPSFGLSFGTYARNGYTRFRVEKVEYQRAAVTVKVDRVESDTPVVWLWKRVTHAPGLIAAGSWSVDVQRSASGATSSASTGWVPLRATLDKVADRLAYWLPRATAGSGTVAWPGGGLTFSSVEWANRSLSAPAVTYRALTGAVTVTTPVAKEWRATVTTPDALGGADLLSDRASVHGSARWWGQSGAVSAHFADHGWLPIDAALRLENWDVAGEKLKLGGHYEHIRGHGVLEWRNGELLADVDVAGEPLAPSAAPPIVVKLRGSGRNGEFTAEKLDVTIPGISATLSDRVVIDRHGSLKSAPAKFTVAADLSEQPWLQARGKITGTGHISAAESGIASIDFAVAGENVAVNQIEATAAEVTGRFAWPVLEIASGKLLAIDGNSLAVKGRWDLRARELSDGVVSGTIGRRTIERWLPAYPQFATAVIEANAAGTWPEIRHHGRIEANGVQLPQMNPMAVKLSWQGQGLAAETFDGQAAAGQTTIRAAGSIDRERLRVATLSLANGDVERLHLLDATELSWKPQLHLAATRLQGTDTAVDGSVDWGETGAIDVHAQQVDARWFRDLVPLRSSAWTIDQFQLQGSWNRGPAEFAGSAQTSIALGDERRGQVAIQLRGSGDGLEILSLRGTEGDGVILDISGKLPVTLHPKASRLVNVDRAGPLRVTAATTENPKFWAEISHLIGVDIAKPEVTARLEGTLDKPKGEVRLTADRIAAVSGKYKFEWPKIEALNVQVTANPEGVKLDTFTVKIDGQLVRAHGTLPISDERWRELLESPKSVLRGGDLRIEVPDAEIAAIAHHFPAYFAPKGKLQLELAFKPDETITGFLKVLDATSRPLGPLGVLQEVNADVEFAGRTVNLRAVTARMGGQLVTLQGKAELPPRGDPQLDFALKGENLPFVRRTGLLVRGDLDLKLTSAGGRTGIHGNVRLRDSLFLADLASLIPTGAKETARRPPYFSVEAVPLNAWTLDVNVQGERFLRLRTPVFNGTASARIRLGGTLGIPRATGEAVVNEGHIRLPFANFEVRQGQVRLTPEQPEPQLLVNATTRRYGYDLRMELTGPASSPNLTFSSSPPLEAEQVLLMVMAGEAPHNEVATTDRQRMARFGAFFGQSILGSLGGDSSGADRLTISSGENISAQGRETYSIEYKLSDKWALTGEYDEFDDYYGGLKWRFYEKGGKKADEKK